MSGPKSKKIRVLGILIIGIGIWFLYRPAGNKGFDGMSKEWEVLILGLLVMLVGFGLVWYSKRRG
ncbi:hypothetical protein GYB29_13095 [bacterium]|nr:hypothetical protein [bacterium]